MAQSVLLSFALFLKTHAYTTSMWEQGYSADDVNQVCHELTKWAQDELGLPGEFLVLWSRQDGITFSGDSELVYANGDKAYLLPNPFIEGDSEGFVVALTTIVAGNEATLYETEIGARVLYNAV